MSVMLMTTLTPRAGDEENRFPAHYSEADQMARFSSTSGCRYNNGKDRVALLAMYIIILHILCPDHRRPRLHHPGENSKVSPSSGPSCPHSSKTYLLLASFARVSPILCSEEVGECLARCTPSRITRNPVVRGIRVVATKSFEGEEINKENIP